MRPFADYECADKEQLSLSIAPLGIIDRREVVERQCNVGMIRPMRFFADRKRALVKLLGFGGAAQFFIEESKVVQRCADLRVISTMRLFENG